MGRDECSTRLGPWGRAGLGSAMGASLTACWCHLGLVFAARLSQTEGFLCRGTWAAQAAHAPVSSVSQTLLSVLPVSSERMKPPLRPHVARGMREGHR